MVDCLIKLKMLVQSRNREGTSRTEGDRREQVVSNVVMRHVVEEEASGPSKKGPINSGDGTSEERPLLITVVGNRGIGVM